MNVRLWPKLLTELGRQYPALTSIRHHENGGYGAAVLSALRSARKDIVFFCDADNQFDVRELPRLLTLIGEADLVTGYRGIRRDPVHRRLNALL